MTTRSEREKALKLNEQHQAILSKMLREEDNKYCADCEAKGPRWASWNLGVFICIRCAGIHRNLGVHISRVKSVNLDQWTQEQIQSVQDMGNTKARKLYEANLPDNFRRPQTDQAVEFFIRDKYEKKKYYDKTGLNGTTTSSDSVLPSASCPSLQTAAEKNKLEKEKEEKKKEKESEKVNKPASFDKLKTPQKKEEKQIDRVSPLKTAEPAIDLLGLDAPAVANGSSTTINAPLSDDLDIFGPMVSNPLPSSTTPFTQATSSKPTAATCAAVSGDLDLFTEATTKSEESAKKPLSKDSILSLYSTGSMQQQQTAPAGMFLGPAQIPFPSQPANFQGFANMGAPMPASTGMMGQPVPMMGQNAGMMVGVAMPNGYMGNTQTGVMGLPQNVMGPQAVMPGNVVSPQNVYGMQTSQQGQWNLSQMNQQMAGMNLVGPSPMMGFGQPANTMGNWTGTTSGQTLSTQLWK
ncbi:stromal membrane-associated protein 1-like isoform X1 [Acipenser ruthenus]|uniref:stromal membrane-associated protein 1-like isoform X1 n=1 Tax=Acipenser ruthenus TaxID=7906 RepID=UPI00145B6332|nr:stromal membrane-associated protein 1-like isoform X1 [Acipenser ruthenus]XP_058879898.1 stromal membrane-associated protein 1-like isoform X1 [Acipenser ruthenus]